MDTQRRPIIVVSGLPRSGTSMMMRMLVRGGLELMSDELRSADASNPLGYFEHESVKRLKDGDHAWVDGAQGKVVKVVSPLLEHLPGEYEYQVIFMIRSLDEILASQAHMLRRNGATNGGGGDDSTKLAESYRSHLRQVQAWIAAAPNVDVLYVQHRDAIDDPESVAVSIEQFLGEGLDHRAMVAAVDQSLYRERSEAG